MTTIHDFFSIVIDLKDEIKSLRREILALKENVQKISTPLTNYYDKSAEITNYIENEQERRLRPEVSPKKEEISLKPTLSVVEVAKILKISTSTIYRWRKAKKIEAELKYPGEIKVNVIRESRVIEYAR